MFQNKQINRGFWGLLLTVIVLGCQQKKDPEPVQRDCQITQYTTITARDTITTHIIYNNEGVITNMNDSITSGNSTIQWRRTLKYGNDGKLAKMILGEGTHAERVLTYTWDKDLLTKIDNGNGTFYEFVYNADHQVIQSNYGTVKKSFIVEKTYYEYNEQSNLTDIKVFQPKNILDSTDRTEILFIHATFSAFDNKRSMFSGIPPYFDGSLRGWKNEFSKNNYTSILLRVDDDRNGTFTPDEMVRSSAGLKYNAHGYVTTFTNYDGLDISFQYQCE